MTIQKVYTLCNTEGYFTCGDNGQYDKMFDMVREERPLHDIALVIWICSEGVPLDDIETQLEAL